jgi:hypothetical protein
MKRSVFLIALCLVGISTVLAYDSTLVFSQFFGMTEGEVRRSSATELADDFESRSGVGMFLRFNDLHWNYGILLVLNMDWKVTAFETSRFDEYDWRDSTTQGILENEIAYLLENGWIISEKNINKNSRPEYLLKRGDEDEISITFDGRWNFKIEQNIKTSWDW